MKVAFPLALFGIFFVLVSVFQSYSKSLLIMAMVPFGIVGAVVGHIVMGYGLSIISIFGIIALSGVVVNDTLVLINQAVRRRRQGASAAEAAIEAGVSRFRPIVLTSITTFVGLAPMMALSTMSTRMFVPMATSLAFGVLIGTLITLFVVPVLYLILEDILKLAGRRSNP